jgi:superfamily II DNA or RNA helicase
MPSSLVAAFRTEVPAPVRSKGEAYLHSGQVSLTERGPTRVVAEVRGRHHYAVVLRVDGGRLAVSCTCPGFDREFDPCKHVWATMVAVDRAGGLDLPAGAYLDPESPDADLDADLLSLLDDEADDGTLVRRAGPRTAGRRMTEAMRRAVSERMKRYWESRQHGRPGRHQGRVWSPPPPPPSWQVFLSQVGPIIQAASAPVTADALFYLFDITRSPAAGGVLIDLVRRQRKRSGEWSVPKAAMITRGDLPAFPPDDRHILQAVCGADTDLAGFDDYWQGLPVPQTFVLNPSLQADLLPRLCRTGRFVVRIDTPGVEDGVVEARLDWDPTPHVFVVRIDGDADAGFEVGGVIRSAHGDRAPSDFLFITSVAVLSGPSAPDGAWTFAPFDPGGGDRWLHSLVELGPVSVPAGEAAALAERLATSHLLHVECPEALRLDTIEEPPRCIARLSASSHGRRHPSAPAATFEVAVAFGYGDREVPPRDVSPVVVDVVQRRTWRRDAAAEAEALETLLSLGVKRPALYRRSSEHDLEVPATRVPALVRTLLGAGWHVETEGQRYRQAGIVSLGVRSGIDWFELHGTIDFDGVSASLPALLAALRRGDTFVTLEDGTLGEIPADWLARGGRIAAMGAFEQDHVRFARAQTALLDAWLAMQPAVTYDEVFERARMELQRFQGVAPEDPPPTFEGALRPYQREALGWFTFLRRFGFGGCLADEMGLGKTVMVLAALEARRGDRNRHGESAAPSLVVVPRSLVFNWRQEAHRFAPGLRVLDYTGGGRRDALDRMGDYDVVLTTYGTLRRDIGELKEVTFDYAILDEAQAIKNARTGSAKAVRLLRARHRLALSGTPVENHLGELWSLFDFLNPGMLGTASVFAGAGPGRRSADDETLSVLARGLRPFILRRTKDQVAADLPARTEQTLYCDLEPAQRALYDELRQHYRARLLGKVSRDGLGRAKLQVLEALLRLRQAACHPGLIDRARAAEPAAKLDVLVPRLQELVEDGRKVLVFSQFTSLLGLLRGRLDEAGLSHAYMDGRTRDRAARVREFQENGCPLFLISLKAGGLGLNLTAAEYVFLLDPWWNPAVEAQAIDRAHRIGQTKPVFAFRLIARDTVEEKVLELQATKRHLADAIVRADESLIRDLRREDLELLLS